MNNGDKRRYHDAPRSDQKLPFLMGECGGGGGVHVFPIGEINSDQLVTHCFQHGGECRGVITPYTYKWKDDDGEDYPHYGGGKSP